MDIVFMGSPEFSIPSLERLYGSSHTIKAVVSSPDKRRGRGGETSPTPVKAKALELGLPVIEVGDLKNPIFERELLELDPDLLVVVAFRILPRNILKIPRRGSINLHASLLPKYRGAAPIHWAVINGESETGCTVFFLDERVDTGKIIKQQKISVDKNETTGDLYNRMKKKGANLLLEAVDEIEAGSYSLQAQDDDRATPAPKLFKDDCRIDFDRPALEVHNKIRGLSPVPTAWAILDGKKFNMYRSKIGPGEKLNSGKLKLEGKDLLAGCADGTVILEEVQLEGKQKMSGFDFINGYTGRGILQ